MNQPIRRIILAASVITCTAHAWGTESGATAQGIRYMSGGVSDEELVELRAQRKSYSLWVVTAAKRSGSYLADVQVVIRDIRRGTVFDGLSDGPWFFIDLPPGQYEVQASVNGESHKRTTNLRRGDHRQIFFYFDTGDEVSPDRVSPFKSNPYGSD
jgi:hypothetical protein